MDNIKQTIKCTKCNNSFTTEENNGKNISICSKCKKKSTQKYIIIGLVGLCLIGGVGMLILNNSKQSKINSFKGVGEVNDSISVKVQNVPIFTIGNLIASKAEINGISGSIDDIESFKRIMQEEITNAEKNNANNIGIPAISFIFEKNSSTISKKGEELISEFDKYYLQTNKNAVIEVEGYTCDLGTNEHNNNVSKKRAETVKEFLLKNNIPENRIEIKWYGKNKNNLFNYPTNEEYRRVIISIKS